MKLLVSTHCSQGERKTDMCECKEGEWVMLPKLDEHAHPVNYFVGFTTLGRTSTFRSVDIPIGLQDYCLRLTSAHMKRLGLEDTLSEAWGKVNGDCGHEVYELIEFASGFKENQILELKKGVISVRKHLPELRRCNERNSYHKRFNLDNWP